MDISSDEDFTATPPEIAEAANVAISNLIPEKSKVQYERTYKQFKDWREKKNVGKISENVLLAYLEEKSNNVMASTLWSVYSVLKTTINIKENIDIRKFYKLISYLKKKSVGHCPKKSLILSREQIKKFIEEAPNDVYLMMKVVLIMGISGACRREEIKRITVDDIENKRSFLIVRVPDTKTNIERTFTVTNLQYIELYKTYLTLRPGHASSRRLFLKYNHGKCVNQAVGITKIGEIPSLIAKYLNLPNANRYTGHCFRQTLATLLVDAGADLTCLKRHGGWKSSTVAEGYIEDSIENKNKISNNILDCEVLNHKTSVPSLNVNESISAPSQSVLTFAGINITSCHDCTINVNIVNNKE